LVSKRIRLDDSYPFIAHIPMETYGAWDGD